MFILLEVTTLSYKFFVIIFKLFKLLLNREKILY